MANIYLYTNNIDPTLLSSVPGVGGYHYYVDIPVAVVYPVNSADPNDVVAALVAAGYVVLPGAYDSVTPVPAAAAAAWAAHGVVAANVTTVAYLKALYAATGLPWLRPNLY